MRKIHQMDIPDPLVSEGECIEYTTNTGRVFHVLAVASDGYWACPGCTFFRFKNERFDVGNDRYICDCGPKGENSLCYKGPIEDMRRCYCRFVDIDTVMEDL